MAAVEDHIAGARQNGSCVGHDDKGKCGSSPPRGLQLRTWLLIKPSSVAQRKVWNIGARARCEVIRLPDPLSPT